MRRTVACNLHAHVCTRQIVEMWSINYSCQRSPQYIIIVNYLILRQYGIVQLLYMFLHTRPTYILWTTLYVLLAKLISRGSSSSKNLVAISENLVWPKLAEALCCTLSSDGKWLLFAEISSQGGMRCSIWLIWLLVEEPLDHCSLKTDINNNVCL